MRVLLSVDAVGGVWTYAVQLANALRGLDIEMLFANLGPEPSRAQRESLASLPRVTLHCAPYRLEWMAGAERDQEPAAIWLQGLARDCAIDVVHLNGYAVARSGWHKPLVVGAHSCVGTWWRAVHGCSPPLDWANYRSGVLAGLRAADRVIAPTAAYLRQLESEYGPLRGKAQVINHGRAAMSEACKGADRQAIVLACGRLWDESKRLGFLDEIAPDLAWPVYIAGSDCAPDGRTHRLSHCTALGELGPGALSEWMGRARIFAHPASYEPFGYAVLEAAQHGCALVLADIDSLREVWEGCAEFVAVADHSAWRTALHELMQDPRRLRARAAAALARARHFTLQRMGLGYARLYHQLCSQPTRVPREEFT